MQSISVAMFLFEATDFGNNVFFAGQLNSASKKSAPCTEDSNRSVFKT
jgi:hypothetical protein